MAEQPQRSRSRESRPALSEDALAQALVPDPGQGPPNAVVLQGYLGRGATDGTWRIYFSAHFDSYVEVNDADILYTRQLPDDQGSLVWVSRSASLQHVQVQSQQVQAEFLAGGISSTHLGAAAAAPLGAPVMPRPAPVSLRCPSDVIPCRSDELPCPSADLPCPPSRLVCPTLPAVCQRSQVVICRPSVITVCPTIQWRCPSVATPCISQQIPCPTTQIPCGSAIRCPSVAICPTRPVVCNISALHCPSADICPSTDICPSLAGCPSGIACNPVGGGGDPGPVFG